LDVLFAVENLSENVFALSFSNESQEVLLVEEFQIVGLQLNVLVNNGDESAVDFVEELPQG
jgi:hypothetical protein